MRRCGLGALLLIAACGRSDIWHYSQGYSGATRVIDVVPTYPAHADWNSYVRNADVTLGEEGQADVGCTGSELGASACLHGGEKRRARLDWLRSCTGLSISDSLDAFDWGCDDAAGQGPVAVFTRGLKPGRGLRDLIDTLGFVENKVEVRLGAAVVAASTPAIWSWTNTIIAAPQSAGTVVLNQPGTIYVVDGTRSIAGYNLDADGVALVTTSGTSLSWSGGANNCSGAGELAGATSSCLVASGNQRFVWIEADLNGSAPAQGILLTVAHSRVNATRVTALGHQAVVLSGATDNVLTDLTVTDNADTGLAVFTASNRNLIRRIEASRNNDGNGSDESDHGVYVLDSHDNRIEDAVAAYNGAYGIRTYQGHRTTLRRITVVGNEYTAGLGLFADDNVAFDITAVANAIAGVDIRGSRNVVAQVRASDNGAYGVRLYCFEGVYRDNTVTDVVAVSNRIDGVLIHESCTSSTLSHVLVDGTTYRGVEIQTGSNNTTLAHIVALNNAGRGLHVGTTGNVFDSVVAAYNGEVGISLAGAGNTFRNTLIVANNTAACSVTASGQGLVNSTCTTSGSEGSSSYGSEASTAVLHVSFDADTVFAGRVLQDDSVNSTDVNGSAAAAQVSDWVGFENPWRAWGIDDPAFMSPAQRGDCTGGATCRIYDWRLRTSATSLRETNGACPSAPNDTRTLTDAQASPNTFLVNALERLDDGDGDDDGLCESGEACLYSPNIGPYQGEGSIIEGACPSAGGARLDRYQQNGAP